MDIDNEGVGFAIIQENLGPLICTVNDRRIANGGLSLELRLLRSVFLVPLAAYIHHL